MSLHRLNALRTLRSAAVAALLGVALAAGAARAEDKPAGDMKPFTQKLPGSELGIDMVPIPGGEFMMGSPDSEKKRKSDEGPQFKVKVDPFYMGKYEITWEVYTEFLNNYHKVKEKLNEIPVEKRVPFPNDKRAEAVSYPTPLYEIEAGPILDAMGRGGKYPAVIMSQHGAKVFTKWLSKRTGRFYRLPTEAEWEYACRAGTATAYSFGDDAKKIDDYAVFFDNAPTKDAPDGAYREVGTKKPNPWGLYDMHGNVAEWVIDQYDPTWYKKFEGKTVTWQEAVNWPNKQYPRVFRGGGWDGEAEDLRSAARKGSNNNMNKRDPQEPKSAYWLSEGFALGFRIISPVKEPTEEEKKKFWEVDDDYTALIMDMKKDREAVELVNPIGTDKK